MKVTTKSILERYDAADLSRWMEMVKKAIREGKKA